MAAAAHSRTTASAARPAIVVVVAALREDVYAVASGSLAKIDREAMNLCRLIMAVSSELYIGLHRRIAYGGLFFLHVQFFPNLCNNVQVSTKIPRMSQPRTWTFSTQFGWLVLTTGFLETKTVLFPY
jgi:hypothetical protein